MDKIHKALWFALAYALLVGITVGYGIWQFGYLHGVNRDCVLSRSPEAIAWYSVYRRYLRISGALLGISLGGIVALAAPAKKKRLAGLTALFTGYILTALVYTIVLPVLRETRFVPGLFFQSVGAILALCTWLIASCFWHISLTGK